MIGFDADDYRRVVDHIVDAFYKNIYDVLEHEEHNWFESLDTRQQWAVSVRNQGIKAFGQRDLPKADELLLNALKVRPDDLITYHACGIVTLFMGDYKAAYKALERADSVIENQIGGPLLDENSFINSVAYGYVLLHRGDYELAGHVFRKCMRIKDIAEPCGVLLQMHVRRGMAFSHLAVDDITAAKEQFNLANDLIHGMGMARWTKETEELYWINHAYSIYCKARMSRRIELEGACHKNASHFFVTVGRSKRTLDEAGYARVQAQALYLFSKFVKRGRVVRATQLASWTRIGRRIVPKLPGEKAAKAFLALGKFYGLQHSYEDAALCIEAGNNIKNTMHPSFSKLKARYDAQYNHNIDLADTRKSFHAHMIDIRLNGGLIKTSHGAQIKRIFILGFPRCGASLIEAALTAQVNIHSVGEVDAIRGLLDKNNAYMPYTIHGLNAMLDDYAGACANKTFISGRSEKWFIDRTSQNVECLGVVLAAFPTSPVIVPERDKFNAVFSAYKEYMEGDHPWQWDPELASLYFDHCERMVDLWDEACPGRIVRVRYEDLVTRFKATMNHIVRNMDIGKRIKSTPFHNYWQHTRTTYSESFAQVRRPVYTSSVKAVDNYKPYLQYFKEDRCQIGKTRQLYLDLEED